MLSGFIFLSIIIGAVILESYLIKRKDRLWKGTPIGTEALKQKDYVFSRLSLGKTYNSKKIELNKVHGAKADWLIQRAHGYRLEEYDKGAIKDLEEAITYRPKGDDLRINLASIYRDHEDMDSAKLIVQDIEFPDLSNPKEYDIYANHTLAELYAYVDDWVNAYKLFSFLSKVKYRENIFSHPDEIKNDLEKIDDAKKWVQVINNMHENLELKKNTKTKIRNKVT